MSPEYFVHLVDILILHMSSISVYTKPGSPQHVSHSTSYHGSVPPENIKFLSNPLLKIFDVDIGCLIYQKFEGGCPTEFKQPIQ